MVSNERAVLSGFTDLLHLVDHPGDIVTWRHFQMTPLAAAMYPDGVPDACDISIEFSKLFAEKGIHRTFVELKDLAVDSLLGQWSAELDRTFEEMVNQSSKALP